ncbi:hypothetical protein BDW22DRAFT_1425207 [Trametopsis cervina]|nr:hypothetical protein BDW22DRAFT_1425207 [Trametopsis cervina]
MVHVCEWHAARYSQTVNNISIPYPKLPPDVAAVDDMAEHMSRLTRIADMLVIAGQNTIRHRRFDADVYATALENGRNIENDPALRQQLGMTGQGEITKVIDFPCIITDRKGRILCWYLPEVLDQATQECTLRGFNQLRPELQKASGIPVDSVRKPTITWRRDAQYFRPKNTCLIPPGILTFAPVWHMPGFSPPKHAPVEGAAWRDFRKTDRWPRWVDELHDLMWAMFTVASICHPRQLAAYNGSLNSLRESGPTFEEAYANWQWPGHGLALISNRQTPFHRDRKTAIGMYDIIATCGRYADGDFAIEELGIRLRYKPGTLINIAGGMLRHAAEVGEGERVAAVCFMREELMEATETAIPFLTDMEHRLTDIEGWIVPDTESQPDDGASNHSQ